MAEAKTGEDGAGAAQGRLSARRRNATGRLSARRRSITGRRRQQPPSPHATKGGTQPYEQCNRTRNGFARFRAISHSMHAQLSYFGLFLLGQTLYLIQPAAYGDMCPSTEGNGGSQCQLNMNKDRNMTKPS